MDDAHHDDRIARLEASVQRLEERLAKTEMVLGMGRPDEEPADAEPAPKAPRPELESVIGQNLFAKVGIVVLAIGGMLTLSLPWNGVPPWLPSACGWLAAIGLFVLAHLLQKAMPMNARFFRGGGMSLLFMASLRLCHFTDPAVLDPSSVAAALLMGGTAMVNLALAWWRRSVVLSGLALIGGAFSALAVEGTVVTMGIASVMLVWAILASRHHGWPWLQVFAIPWGFLVYLLWMLGDPQFGDGLNMATTPVWALAVLVAWMVVGALALLWRQRPDGERLDLPVGTALNAGGYLLFLLHTMTGFSQLLAPANITVSLVLLGLAVLFWRREHNHFATFVYAMTGYTALTVALIKLSAPPDLFGWLSAQSLLVVCTALWFRSRFIIVANFLIYLGVISGYMMLSDEERGMGLVFVLVALTSARILRWQKDRLELKTELMRNAYLTSAFLVFPYTLYHIVPSSWVAPSWVGIALLYYLMNWLTKARKYRWMAHNTLLLTVGYIAVTGIGRMQGTQRVVTFLLLGTVLLVVSLVFTVIHARQQRKSAVGEPDGDGGQAD